MTAPFEPRYVPAPVASCPDCGGDLIDEGFNFYCPADQTSYTPAQAAYFDEGNLADD